MENIDHDPPYIVITGKSGDENAQFYVCGERMILVESKSFVDCILDLMCCYFVFDIVYPESLSGILLFIQKYLLKIEDEQVNPPCLSKLVKNLSAIDID